MKKIKKGREELDHNGSSAFHLNFRDKHWSLKEVNDWERGAQSSGIFPLSAPPPWSDSLVSSSSRVAPVLLRPQVIPASSCALLRSGTRIRLGTLPSPTCAFLSRCSASRAFRIEIQLDYQNLTNLLTTAPAQIVSTAVILLS